jgi:hypothetical protein
MTKTDRIQLASQIIARVKKEMQEQRLAASVRNSVSSKEAPYLIETGSSLGNA